MEKMYQKMDDWNKDIYGKIWTQMQMDLRKNGLYEMNLLKMEIILIYGLMYLDPNWVIHCGIILCDIL